MESGEFEAVLARVGGRPATPITSTSALITYYQLLKIHRRTSEPEQEMALKLASIKTLRESYGAGVIKATKSLKYPPEPTLLDRVSLWFVTSRRKEYPGLGV